MWGKIERQAVIACCAVADLRAYLESHVSLRRILAIDSLDRVATCQGYKNAKRKAKVQRTLESGRAIGGLLRKIEVPTNWLEYVADGFAWGWLVRDRDSQARDLYLRGVWDAYSDCDHAQDIHQVAADLRQVSIEPNTVRSVVKHASQDQTNNATKKDIGVKSVAQLEGANHSKAPRAVHWHESTFATQSALQHRNSNFAASRTLNVSSERAPVVIDLTECKDSSTLSASPDVEQGDSQRRHQQLPDNKDELSDSEAETLIGDGESTKNDLFQVSRTRINSVLTKCHSKAHALKNTNA